MTKVGSLVLLSGMLIGACGVGDDSSGGGGGDGGADPNPNRYKCTAAFTTQGTWTEGQPVRPVEVPTGCWPVGTWTFTATVDDAQEVVDITGDGVGDRCGTVPGTTAPSVDASYSFRVDRVDDPASDGWVESYAYLGDMATFNKVSVSEGGVGDCEGDLELLSVDKKELWVLHPAQTGTTIVGTGEYTLYLDPQTL
ncbi:MAG: hypothetical protein H6Q90_4532 [Deltaproteobacteria bacterium]|nr:hypothetical protein [Deltaproteobacteria bacterium]